MATSSKTRASRGGPGAAHESAKSPLKIEKLTADDPMRRHSRVSGGGGGHDLHHVHRPADKGGGSDPTRKARS